MRSIDFFETHPVFSHAEFVEAGESGGRSRATSNNLLAKHLAAGRIIRVRRGLYATVPRGVDPAQAEVDPYLVATKLTDDAVVAYHAALQFHGKAYSVWRRLDYLTGKRSRVFFFRGQEFVPVQVPTVLRARPDLGGGVSDVRHAGGRVRVTSLERALVDCLDRPGRSGGWEEVWRSLEMVEFFNLNYVVDYAVSLGSALTIARLGFFLEQHKDELMVERGHLEHLQEYAPAQPRYLDNSRKAGKLVRSWNLVVPEHILDRRWAEVG
jgi:predicted transcriptional regulator of viral defense system